MAPAGGGRGGETEGEVVAPAAWKRVGSFVMSRARLAADLGGVAVARRWD